MKHIFQKYNSIYMYSTCLHFDIEVYVIYKP